MVWVIVHRTRQKRKPRVRLKDGRITPEFEYPEQAMKYIQRYLGDGNYFDIIWVGKK